MSHGKLAAVDSYVASFPPDAALILERLRETVHKAAPANPELEAWIAPLMAKRKSEPRLR